MNSKNPICSRQDIKAWVVCYDDMGDPFGPQQWKVNVEIYGRVLRSQWLKKTEAEDMVLRITGHPPRKCPWCLKENAQLGFASCKECAELSAKMAERPEAAGRLMSKIEDQK